MIYLIHYKKTSNFFLFCKESDSKYFKLRGLRWALLQEFNSAAGALEKPYTKRNECGSVPIELYLQKQAAAGFGLGGECSIPSPAVYLGAERMDSGVCPLCLYLAFTM